MYEGRVCGTECYQEYQWRKTLSVLGKPYRSYGSLDFLGKELEELKNDDDH